VKAVVEASGGKVVSRFAAREQPVAGRVALPARIKLSHQTTNWRRSKA